MKLEPKEIFNVKRVFGDGRTPVEPCHAGAGMRLLPLTEKRGGDSVVMEVQVTDPVADPGDAAARPNIVARLKVESAAMTPGERRVAGATSAPEAVIGFSISELSTSAGVSESTTSRLCVRVGTTGFPGLRIALAPALERRLALSGNVEVGDDIGAMIEKVGLAEINDIKDTVGLPDPSAVEAAARCETTTQAYEKSYVALESRRLAVGQAGRAQHSSKSQAPADRAVVPGRE